MIKSRLYIYIIAGGFLAYNGFGLAKSALTQRPENYIVYSVIGVLFIVIGGFIAVKNVLKISRGDYIDPMESLEEELLEDTKEDIEDKEPESDSRS
ncbi:MAG: hypothetical protein HFH03_07860 [Dorea sp.]|jgi:hypothetical protein|nr:hypothetical protein [Dorea sp.]